MKMTIKPDPAAPRRGKHNCLAAAFAGTLAFTIASLSAEEAPATAALDTVKTAGGAHDLAKQLQNPIAALISVPLQSNFDFGGGPNGDGFQYKLNVQPVIPISLNEDWNIISRTIVPIIYQENIIPRVDYSRTPPRLDETTSQSGMGDITPSLFLSPKKLIGGWTMGAGPVFLLPSATDKYLGSEKWGAGPTAVVLKQEHGWTFGMLANHIWSFAGNDERDYVSTTYLQPFLVKTIGATSYAINTESAYDWNAQQWTIPINLLVKHVTKIGDQRVQFEFGPRYYADKGPYGPEWGLRFNVTLLWPTE